MASYCSVRSLGIVALYSYLTVHGIFVHDHELTEAPEGVFLVVEVHEEQGGDLRHALAVPDLTVVHGVRGEHVEKHHLQRVERRKG